MASQNTTLPTLIPLSRSSISSLLTNPVSQTTELSFTIPRPSDIDLEIASPAMSDRSDPSAAMFHKTTSGNVKESELINSGRDTTVQKNYNVFNIRGEILALVISYIQIAIQFVVARTRSADGKEPDLVDISNMIPPDPSSFPVSSIADRYTRSMLERLIGYPLYEPHPFSELSTEYPRNGVTIGDVGFIRQDGAFDFLFNVCPPQNDSINPPNLPDGFSLETHSETRAMRPLPRETSIFPGTVTITESGEYICEGSEGAILELPEGAIQDEAINVGPFAGLAKLHGVEWYKYTMNRGRNISNGSLYLVTSFTKCTHWGIAVFDRPCKPGQALTFVHSPFSWEGSKGFTTKVSDTNKGDSPNQCVFLQGYKIMIRQDIFDNLCNNQPGGSDQAVPSSSRQGEGISLTRQPATRIRGGGGTDSLSSILSGKNPFNRKTTFPVNVTTSNKVALHANFNSSPVHPSDLVNAALLYQNPDAKVALTHDNVWCDLLRDNFPKLDYARLMDIARSYTSAIDEYGCISLEKISDPNKILGPLTNDPPTLSPRLNYSTQQQHVTSLRNTSYRAEHPSRSGGPSRPRGGRGDGFGRGGGPRGPRGGDGFGRGGGPRGPRGRGSRGGAFRRGGRSPSWPIIYPPNDPPTLPPRLDDNIQQQLVTNFTKAGYRAERPLRPGFGTLGAPIKLRANFFAVKLPKGPYYDYAVVVTDTSHPSTKGKKKEKGKSQGGDPAEPSTTESPIKRRIFELLEAQPAFQPYKAFVTHDYSQRLVAAKKLPQPLEIKVTFVEEGETQPRAGAKIYNVSARYLGEIDLNLLCQYTEANLQYRDYNMQPIISALNLTLQHHARHTGVRVRKEFFFDPGQNRHRLVAGSEVWQGFFISVRPAFKQLMVNINVCYTAFIEPGNLAEALFAIGGNTHGAMPTLPPSIANSIKVKTKHLNHRKKLHKIGTTTARNTFFKCSEYGDINISVEQYFQRKYGIKLKHATDLPVVSLGVIDKNGTKSHNWVPAEICDIIVGLPRRGRLSEFEASKMIKFACNPPGINARDIVETGLPRLGFTPNSSPVLNSFGIEIENKMTGVPARVLPPPRLAYREGKSDVKDGAWNVLNVKFQRGAQVRPWWVLYVNDSRGTRQREEIKPLIEAFRDKCGRLGMAISREMPVLLPIASLNKINNDDQSRTRALRHIQDILTNALGKGKPSFVLVLLERTDKFIYPGIKRICDVTLGIHTVHMQLDKALNPRKQDQYLSNVALKVNTKLGGINHKLDDAAMKWLRKKPTMMVGIDVTHAGPGSRAGTPSIAAVVASIDDSFVHFPCSMGIQEYDAKKDNKEMVDNLCDMLVERIKAYEAHNKRFPERIFVFRSGVSDGQFPVILREEYPKILKAFEKLSVKAKYKPQLSIVVCGKRHRAKFPATDAQIADRNGNTKPGTVVDKGVTSVFNYDFYLQSHAGLQGTVKSTHYTVIFDENRFDPDEIQKGMYDQCYLYACATRSVSIIPPAYYADLACERGQCHLNEFLNAEDQFTSASIKSGKSDLERERQRVYEEAKAYWGDGVHSDLRASMFYL